MEALVGLNGITIQLHSFIPIIVYSTKVAVAVVVVLIAITRGPPHVLLHFKRRGNSSSPSFDMTMKRTDYCG
jgi:hypothetical protein